MHRRPTPSHSQPSATRSPSVHARAALDDASPAGAPGVASAGATAVSTFSGAAGASAVSTFAGAAGATTVSTFAGTTGTSTFAGAAGATGTATSGDASPGAVAAGEHASASTSPPHHRLALAPRISPASHIPGPTTRHAAHAAAASQAHVLG